MTSVTRIVASLGSLKLSVWLQPAADCLGNCLTRAESPLLVWFIMKFYWEHMCNVHIIHMNIGYSWLQREIKIWPLRWALNRTVGFLNQGSHYSIWVDLNNKPVGRCDYFKAIKLKLPWAGPRRHLLAVCCYNSCFYVYTLVCCCHWIVWIHIF